MRIFISYRRGDSTDVAGRIYDRLEAQFGAHSVLKDVDSIRPGQDFRTEIERQILQCDVVVALIGPRWAGADTVGGRRIDDPGDFVRTELALALQRNVPIIPLLVYDASMPAPNELPVSLSELSYRNAIPVRADPDFRRDMDRVIQGISLLQPQARPMPQQAYPYPMPQQPFHYATTPVPAPATANQSLQPAIRAGITFGTIILGMSGVVTTIGALITASAGPQGASEDSTLYAARVAGPLLILGAIGTVVSIVNVGMYLLAGRSAAKRTGTAKSGALAGVVALAVSVVGNLALSGLLNLLGVATAPRVSSTGPDVAVVVIVSGIAGLAISAGVGALGGLIGQRAYLTARVAVGYPPPPQR